MTLSDLGPYPTAKGYEEAIALDSADALAGRRGDFVDADPGLIYLDGNSLGRLPRRAIDLTRAVVEEQWGDRLIRSWNEGWWDLQVRLGDKLATLIGAGTGEVIVSDSTTVNLHKLAQAAMDSAPEGRRRIVTDDLNFPTDVYVLSQVAQRSRGELVIVQSDGVTGPTAEIDAAIDDTTALVALSHTAFKSGYTYDMMDITSIAHRAGAMMLWDLSHSVGVVPIDLAGSGVDLAVGCTYKYLNGGPGSPAFLYVRRDHQGELENPISGWWGHEDPFAFDLSYSPVEGMRRFHAGTMPILSLAAIEPGLDTVMAAGIDAVRDKSIRLTEYLIDQVREHLTGLGFNIASPLDPARRGSHVAIAHDMAWPITRALVAEAKVIPDYRTPDSIRLGLAPLYTSFADVHTAVQRIARLVGAGAHHAHVDTRAAVT